MCDIFTDRVSTGGNTIVSVCLHCLLNRLTFDLDLLHVWIVTIALLELKVKVNPSSNLTPTLDEQFLQFSGLSFVTLGPFNCA